MTDWKLLLVVLVATITFSSPGITNPTTTISPHSRHHDSKKGETGYKKLTLPTMPRRSSNVQTAIKGSVQPTLATPPSQNPGRTAVPRATVSTSLGISLRQTPAAPVSPANANEIVQGSCERFQYEFQNPISIQTDVPQMEPDTSGNFPDEAFSHVTLQEESNVEANLFCKVDRKRNCKIQINEVLPTIQTNNGHTTRMFVEIRRNCDLRITQPINLMDGYMVVIIDLQAHNRASTAPHGVILFTADLSGKSFPSPAENDNQNSYYVIGTKNTNNANLHIDGTSGPVYHIQNKAERYVNAIPVEEPSPKAVMLLYFKASHRRHPRRHQEVLNQFKLQALNDGNHPIVVTPSLKNFIKRNLVDLFVYGSACTQEERNLLHQYYSNFPENCEDYISTSRFNRNEYQSLTINSFSKCSSDSSFDGRSYVDSVPSPGEKNVCQPQPTSLLPYNFANRRLDLPLECKKVVANTWESLWNSKHNPNIFDGTPLQATSRITGLPVKTVRRIVKLHRANEIEKKKTQKKTCCKTMIQIDSFDRTWIRESIARFYKNNVAATAKQLYQEFLNYKEDHRKNMQSLFATNPLITVPEPFYCSENTFRRVLHILGFKYGKINNRAAIIQRPDLVRWRGRYLKAIRDNDKLKETGGKPKKLVYLDETWIDSNMRTVKGWVPRRQENHREMALYTFGTMKVGRGPRLIVLSAVMESEVIKDSILVYPVSKSESEFEDYHKNINHETFMEWFKKLLLELEKRKAATGDDYILVMDNAPYHSKRLYPLKSDTKRTLYDWLKKYESDADLHFTLPEYNIIRKWELELLLARVITKKQMAAELFVIDKLAKEKGFQILRNAPYHCFFSPIEYTWKDVKHDVRKLNVEQNIRTLQPIVEKILKEYPADKLKKHFAHVKNLENAFWEQDGIFDDQPDLQPIVISLDQSGDESDEEDLNDFSQCHDFASDMTTEDVGFQSMDGNNISDNDEYIETDGTIHLDDGCTPETGFEDEIATFMASRPAKRPRLNPMCISQDLY